MDAPWEAGLARLWSELGLDDASFRTHRSSAAAFRGLMHALTTLGYFADVAHDVPAPVAKVMQTPPLSGAWIPDVAFYYVLRSTRALVTEAEFREVARVSMWNGPIKVMRPFIEGMLRLFNASPHGLLARVPQVMGRMMRGATFSYEKVSDTAAIITIAQPSPPRDNAQGELTSIYWEEVLWSAVDLCKRPRDRVETQVERNDDTLLTSLRVSWG